MYKWRLEYKCGTCGRVIANLQGDTYTQALDSFRQCHCEARRKDFKIISVQRND